MYLVFKIAVIIFLAKLANTDILNAKCESTAAKSLAYKELTIEIFQKIIANIRNATDKIVINFPNCNVENVHKNAFQNYSDISEIRLNENSIQDLVIGTFDRNINLEILMLNDNILKKLKYGIFAHQLNLKKIYLQNNKIDYIQRQVFMNISLLQILNLASNKLENLNKDLFHNNTNLKYLNIASNSISYLENTIFETLTRLEKLYLTNNKIIYIHKHLFENLRSLVRLDLSYNLISNLQLEIFNKTTKLEYLYVDLNSIKKENEIFHNIIKHLVFINDLKDETIIKTNIGDTVNLTCHVKDSITLNEVYWLQNEIKIMGNQFLIMTNKDGSGGLWYNLTIYNITKENEDIYKCVSDEENPSKTFVKINVLSSEEEKNKNYILVYIAIICCAVGLAVILIFVIINRKYKKSKLANTNFEKYEMNISAQSDEIRNQLVSELEAQYSYAYFEPNEVTSVEGRHPLSDEIRNQPASELEDQYSYAYIEPNKVTSMEGRHPLIARNLSLLEG